MLRLVFILCAFTSLTLRAEIPPEVQRLRTLQAAQIELFGMMGFENSDVGMVILEIRDEVDPDKLLGAIRSAIAQEKDKLKLRVHRRRTTRIAIEDSAKWNEQIKKMEEEVAKLDELDRRFAEIPEIENLRTNLISEALRVRNLPNGVKHDIRRALENAPADPEAFFRIIDAASMERYQAGFDDERYDQEGLALKHMANRYRSSVGGARPLSSPVGRVDCGGSAGLSRFAGAASATKM